MKEGGKIVPSMAAKYFNLFVNRAAYTVQSKKAGCQWQVLLLPAQRPTAVGLRDNFGPPKGRNYSWALCNQSQDPTFKVDCN